MTSKKKLQKVDKRHSWGRGGGFLKGIGKIKRLCFYNKTERVLNKKVETD